MRRLTAVIFLFALCAQAHQFSGVDYIIQKAIGDHHTPGATVIIGTSEQILYHQAYGHFTYNASSTVVDTAHMFDLASLTKVIATTSCIMKLVDSGQLSIEDSVVSYIPAFGQNHKAGVRIKHCLLHTSGLPAYYSPSSSQSPEQILAAIYARSLQNPIGSTYLYSCLNFVTLMKVVEAVTGQAMWEYYRDQFTDPLGMERTLFCPPDSLHDECLPTSSVTGYRGVVHDPLARGLDGLSGNAGLFSTTADIAKLCQLLLNKGEYDDQRLLSEATVNRFTTRYNASTSRALGWGTNAYGSSSAGSLLSPQAIGHTGYTGTSVWCDPVKDIFIVLLTNRVYPNDTASITSTRAAVADAAVRAVEGIPPQPVLKYIRYGENSHLELAWEPNLAMGAVDATEIWLDFGSGFQLEQTVPPDTTRLSLALDAFPPDSTISTKIVNVYDSQPSSPSDIYAVRGSQKQLLIVDGYDRIGSWGAASHHFATVHAKALPDTVRFSGFWPMRAHRMKRSTRRSRKKCGTTSRTVAASLSAVPKSAGIFRTKDQIPIILSITNS